MVQSVSRSASTAKPASAGGIPAVRRRQSEHSSDVDDGEPGEDEGCDADESEYPHSFQSHEILRSAFFRMFVLRGN